MPSIVINGERVNVPTNFRDMSSSEQQQWYSNYQQSKATASSGSGVLGGASKGVTAGTGEDRHRGLSAISGIGSGRYPGQLGPTQPGDELNALDQLANEQSGSPETYDTGMESKRAFDEAYSKKLDEVWEALSPEQKEEWSTKSKWAATWRGFLDGISPINLKAGQDLETQAKWRRLQETHPKSFSNASLAGIGVGLFAGSYKGGKALEIVADVALEGPREALRASSRSLNNAAKKFDKVAEGAESTVRQNDYLRLTGETAEEAGAKYRKMAAELRDFDIRMVDGEKRFGIKKNREIKRDELSIRASAAENAGTPDVIREALGDKADDIYKNMFEGDARSRGQVTNIFQQYIAEPLNYNAKVALERLPAGVISAVAHLGAGAITSFAYAFEHFYSNKDYNAEDAAAAAYSYASEFSLGDLTAVGAAAGIASDVTEGALSKSQGGLLSMKDVKSNMGNKQTNKKVRGGVLMR